MSTYRSGTGRWNLAAIMNDVVTAWRLFWNPRVPTALKVLLPAAAMVYWLSPIDLLPGLPFDDIALMILALRMFVSLAPADAQEATQGAWQGARSSQDDATRRNGGQDVVDTTWTVVDD